MSPVAAMRTLWRSVVPMLLMETEVFSLKSRPASSRRKAKRRLTLSLAGLGWSDETEVESLAETPLPARPTLAERAAAKAAEVTVLTGPMPEAESVELPINVEEVADTPAVSVGLSLETFHTLCVKAGKSTVAIAKAIDCVPADVGRRVKAMSPVELAVLADELDIPWRQP
jgi:hypothetical protein